MRIIVKYVVPALAAIFTLSGAACGQAPSLEAGATPTLPAIGKVPLGIGDKLKIAFFETLEVGNTKQAGGEGNELRSTLRTFYQRMDLSGEYTIDQDGTISLPLLGRFQIEGRPVEDVQTELSASFSDLMGRTANVNVKIAERPPVYVVGPVKNPGAYKYAPGMIVLHAIALAGGLGHGDQLSGPIDRAREMERLRNTTQQMKRLLARRARLEADRDGSAGVPMSVQLTNLAGQDDARTFLASENEILSAERAKRDQQKREIALKASAARNEVEALKQKLDQIEVQKEMRVERLTDMQKLKDRGLNTTNNVIVLRTELSDIEAHRQDYVVSIVQAQARLAEAEEAKLRLTTDSRADIAKSLASLEQEIVVARDAMISAGMLVTVLYGGNGLDSAQQTYEIVRQTRDGSRTLQASETTPLQPGDVLKIGTGAPSADRKIAPTMSFFHADNSN